MLLQPQKLLDKRLKNKRQLQWPRQELKKLKELQQLSKPKSRQLLRNSKKPRPQRLLPSKLKRIDLKRNRDWLSLQNNKELKMSKKNKDLRKKKLLKMPG